MADGKRSMWRVSSVLDHQDFIRTVIAENIVEAANEALVRLSRDYASYNPLDLSVITKVECLGTED
jgi:hypothetical protein